MNMNLVFVTVNIYTFGTSVQTRPNIKAVNLNHNFQLSPQDRFNFTELVKYNFFFFIIKSKVRHFFPLYFTAPDGKPT